MKRSYHLIALFILLCFAVLPARADNPPVGYENCASEDYPILIVNGTSYGPGVSTDTIDYVFGVDTLAIQFVMGMDDSTTATPPCKCDTMERTLPALNWCFRMYVWAEGPFPRDSTVEYSQAARYGQAPVSCSCPDTFAVETLTFERCGDALITAEGRVWIGGASDCTGGEELAPSGDNVVIPVRVSMPSSSGGTWVLATKEGAS